MKSSPSSAPESASASELAHRRFVGIEERQEIGVHDGMLRSKLQLLQADVGRTGVQGMPRIRPVSGKGVVAFGEALQVDRNADAFLRRLEDDEGRRWCRRGRS